MKTLPAKFKQLRTVMYSEQIGQEELGKQIGRSVSYVSLRMIGKKPFNMDDVYRICDALHISYAEIPTYFPMNGQSQ